MHGWETASFVPTGEGVTANSGQGMLLLYVCVNKSVKHISYIDLWNTRLPSYVFLAVRWGRTDAWVPWERNPAEKNSTLPLGACNRNNVWKACDLACMHHMVNCCANASLRSVSISSMAEKTNTSASISDPSVSALVNVMNMNLHSTRVCSMSSHPSRGILSLLIPKYMVFGWMRSSSINMTVLFTRFMRRCFLKSHACDTLGLFLWLHQSVDSSASAYLPRSMYDMVCNDFGAYMLDLKSFVRL